MFFFTFCIGLNVDYRLKDGEGNPLPLFIGLHYAIKNRGTGYFLSISGFEKMYENGPDYQDKEYWFRFHETPLPNRGNGCIYRIHDTFVCLSEAKDGYFNICKLIMLNYSSLTQIFIDEIIRSNRCFVDGYGLLGYSHQFLKQVYCEDDSNYQWQFILYPSYKLNARLIDFNFTQPSMVN